MSAKRLSSTAALAAVYALTTLLLAPLSFGVVQCRIAEVLCLLPYWFPGSVWGLFLGCALANLLSGNILDFLFGSLATLLSALCVRKSRSPALACLWPVLFNGVIVGAVLTVGYENINILTGSRIYALNALSVASGEALVVFGIGLPLLKRLPEQKLFGFLAEHFDCTKERV